MYFIYDTIKFYVMIYKLTVLLGLKYATNYCDILFYVFFSNKHLPKFASIVYL